VSVGAWAAGWTRCGSLDHIIDSWRMAFRTHQFRSSYFELLLSLHSRSCIC